MYGYHRDTLPITFGATRTDLRLILRYFQYEGMEAHMWAK